MRHFAPIVLTLIFSFTGGPIMTTRASDNTVLTQTLVLTPGQWWNECVEVDEGAISLEASAPEGRTGETARLTVYSEATPRGPALIDTSLTQWPMSSRHRVDAGRYCVNVIVSNLYPDVGDPNRPERPYKLVSLTIRHEPA